MCIHLPLVFTAWYPRFVQPGGEVKHPSHCLGTPYISRHEHTNMGRTFVDGTLFGLLKGEQKETTHLEGSLKHPYMGFGPNAIRTPTESFKGHKRIAVNSNRKKKKNCPWNFLEFLHVQHVGLDARCNPSSQPSGYQRNVNQKSAHL